MITKKDGKHNSNPETRANLLVRHGFYRLCAGMLLLLGLCGAAGAESSSAALPEGFCLLSQIAPGIPLDIRYAGHDNFVGRPIAGYEAPLGVMTCQAALALAEVQQALQSEDFAAWAEDPADTAMQASYYPDIPKDRLFSLGYIARRSGHSRGSTVDVGLLDSAGTPLDMGCGFDTFGPIAAHGAKGLTAQQRENRTLLLDVMQAHGFKPYSKEWWHYTLRDEPFPDTLFDFPITGALAQRDTE